MFRIIFRSRSWGKDIKHRKNSGSALVILALWILLAVFMIGVMGLDIAHNCTSRTSLQSATDSAALAGAAKIVMESINPPGAPNWNPEIPSLSYPSVNASDVMNTAMAAAALNSSDGHFVSTAAGVNFASSQWYTQTANDNAPGVPQNCGVCMVQASETIQNLFAGIIGHPQATVTTQSQATAYVTVASVNQNVAFPIAVSIDTLNGHSGGGNNPLNKSKIGDTITFYMEMPCANAAWTTYNTGNGKGDGAAEVDAKAVNYIDTALASVTGSGYKPNTVPVQTVGETSYYNGAAGASGIDLFGAIQNVGGANAVQAGAAMSKGLVGNTIILPVIAGDFPYFDLDSSSNGNQFSPGAHQTRPLVGFCALQVTQVTWDDPNNTLLSISGKLVKALVKGVPGLPQPKVNPSAALTAIDVAALDNLSPGMVQLGSTNMNTLTSPQPQLDSWYTGGPVPPGNNVSSVAGEDDTTIQPINPNFITFMNSDMNGLCGGVTYNEGVNYCSPPVVAGAISVKQSPDPSAPPTSKPPGGPYDQIMVQPNTTLTITTNYSDEVGLNLGNDIKFSANSDGYGALGASNPLNAPRYEVIDTNFNVVQGWQNITVGAGNGYTWPFTMKITDSSQPGQAPGERLVVIHAFDTDLTHGGAAASSLPQTYYPGAPGTPPGGLPNGQWDGDAAFYYLDLQTPVCSSP